MVIRGRSVRSLNFPRRAKLAKTAGVPCETIHLEEGLPFEGIIKVANARDCDLILMVLVYR